jgi:hypothetical protein
MLKDNPEIPGDVLILRLFNLCRKVSIDGNVGMVLGEVLGGELVGC